VIKLGAKTACEFPNYLAPSFPRYLAAPSCAGLIPGGEWLGHPVPNAPNIVENDTQITSQNCDFGNYFARFFGRYFAYSLSKVKDSTWMNWLASPRCLANERLSVLNFCTLTLTTADRLPRLLGKPGSLIEPPVV
jgi:hypothetical protein